MDIVMDKRHTMKGGDTARESQGSPGLHAPVAITS